MLALHAGSWTSKASACFKQKQIALSHVVFVFTQGLLLQERRSFWMQIGQQIIINDVNAGTLVDK